ncbi:hypothetical protein LXL04_036774 [Taraxacum kok-saghyz]
MGLHLWKITKIIVALFEVILFLRISDAAKNASFDENYKITWGNQHVQLLNQGREVQLTLDKSSGAGFASKAFFASGFFQMKIKLPAKDSGGLVTAFYLFLNTTIHDEVDFEFLGNRPGKPVTLQTNVFTKGLGGREQKFNLWFDPGADFHYYKLLWNQRQLVFFVDDTPIRVYKNNIDKGIGYPNNTMQVIVSLWDGSDWATDGGKTKANFSNAPFRANFQDFNIDGCPASMPKGPKKDCFAPSFWWNTKKNWQLNPQQQKALEDVRKKHMNYDYCTDKVRYPKPRPECIGNNATRDMSFDDNYSVTWGGDHIVFSEQRQQIQLSLDNYSGSGFGSKAYYGSGYFQMRIKVPGRDSAGVVTAFYLNTNKGGHDELDFEFLGNRPGKPITLQTNVITNGFGGREQRVRLWFDPSRNFHYYKLLWNQHQIVFLVDNTPIRVYKNNMRNGVRFPQKPMQLLASLWDGSNWATDGGKTKINYSHAPFEAQFQDFRVDGCVSLSNNPNKHCYSSRYPWNNKKYWQLNSYQLRAYENVKRKYMNYDYCTDRARYPKPLPECRDE